MADTSPRQGLHNLIAPNGARQAKKRLGRGLGSGLGKNSGRGNKGQKKTKSGNVRPGFEGGQLPLARRLPKRGFKNFDFRVDYAEVNVGRLAERFEKGAVVDPAAMVAAGLITKAKLPVKILGNGELAHALTIRAHKISAGARAKVEKAGGTIEVLDAAAAKA